MSLLKVSNQELEEKKKWKIKLYLHLPIELKEKMERIREHYRSPNLTHAMKLLIEDSFIRITKKREE